MVAVTRSYFLFGVRREIQAGEPSTQSRHLSTVLVASTRNCWRERAAKMSSKAATIFFTDYAQAALAPRNWNQSRRQY